jgi:thiol:disulfide interchange protein DsbD
MISKYNKYAAFICFNGFRGNSLNEEKPTISYVSIEEYGTWLKSGISTQK